MKLSKIQRLNRGSGATKAHVLERFGYLFRATGAGIINFKKRSEQRKILLVKSLRVAFVRSAAIHFLPSAISIALVRINIDKYFIGGELQGISGHDDIKLGALQVAAKIQELLIVASLGTVVMHVVRSELIHGDGLPLGFIMSGWSFATLSYFWSPDFWGGVLSTEKRRKNPAKHGLFILLIILAGIIAVLCGPSTAVLMIPREQVFPIGGGIFWINGSDEEIWPVHLDENSDPLSGSRNCSDLETWPLRPECPAAGFQSLFLHHQNWRIYEPERYITVDWHIDMSVGRYSFDIQDRQLRKQVNVHPPTSAKMDTWVITAHAAIAEAQDMMHTMHQKAFGFLRRTKINHRPYPHHLEWATVKRYELDTKVPGVRTTCLRHGKTDITSSNLTVRFPILPDIGRVGQLPDLKLVDQAGRDRFQNEGRKRKKNGYNDYAFDAINVTAEVRQAFSQRGLLLGNNMIDEEILFGRRGSMSTGGRRVFAVPVSIWNDTASSLGIVLIHKILESRTAKWVTQVTTCSVDARWFEAKSIIETTASTKLLPYDGKAVLNRVHVEIPESDHRPGNAPMPKGHDDGSGRVPTKIRLTPGWFGLLSPVLSRNPMVLSFQDNDDEIQTAQYTTLEAILEVGAVETEGLRVAATQAAIGTVVADGLSRHGLLSNPVPGVLQDKESRYGEYWIDDEEFARKIFRVGDPIESFSKPESLAGWNTTQIVVRARYTGYAMMLSGWFDYLAVSILLTHSLVALAHLCWAVGGRETSSAWDTMLELVALAVRSPVPGEGEEKEEGGGGEGEGGEGGGGNNSGGVRVLQNTSAGVRSFKTVGSIAWVEAMSGKETTGSGSSGSSGSEVEVERLRLRFKNGLADRDPKLRPVAGRKYD